MSKKCPWCKVDVYLTELKHWYKCPECQTEFPERAFPKEITLFDRITVNEETLAKKLVYAPLGEFCKLWYSTVLPGEHWNVKPEAIAATMEKLKEVANG